MADTYQSVFELRTSGGAALKTLLSGIVKQQGDLLKSTDRLKKQGSVSDIITGKNPAASLKVQQQIRAEMLQTERILTLISTKMAETTNVAAWRRLAAAQENWNSKLEQGRMELDRINNRVDNLDSMGGGGFFGSPFSGARSASQLITTGAGGYGNEATQKLQEALQSISDLGDGATQLSSEIENLYRFLPQVGAGFKIIATSAVGVITGSTSVAVAWGAITAAISPFLIVAIPIVAAFAAVGHALKVAGDNAERARAAMQRQIALEDHLRGVTLSVQEAIRGGEIESARQRLVTTRAEQAAVNRDYQTRRARLQELMDLQARQHTLFDAMFNLDAANATGKEIDDLRDNLKTLEAELQELNVDITEWERALADIEAAAKAKEAAERLKQAEEDLAAARDDGTRSLQQYQKQLARTEADLKLNRNRELEDRRIADRRGLSDHLDSLRDIQAQSNKTIEGLRKDLAKAEADALKSLGKAIDQIDIDLAKSETRTKKRFFESERKALEGHLRDLEDREDAYALQRLRRMEDLHKTLRQAELDNDVLSYMAAQDESETELARMEQDHQIERMQADEAFQLQRQESREQFNLEIRELREQAAERRAELQTQFAEDKAQRLLAHQERLQEEALRLQESLQQTQASFDKRAQLEAEDRKLRDDRWREDVKRQREQTAEDFAEQLREREAHENRLLAIIKNRGYEQQAAVDRSQAEVLRLFQDYGKRVAQTVASLLVVPTIQTGASGGGSSGFGGGTTTLSVFGQPSAFATAAFRMLGAAKGIHVDRPTPLVAGEGEAPEVVFPLTPSNGIPDHILAKMGQSLGQGGVTINGPITIDGDGVTIAEVESALTKMGAAIVSGVRQARAGASA